MRAVRPVVFVSAVIVAAAALSGCSTIAAVAKVQSHAAACIQIDSQLTAATKAMKSDVPMLQSDPKGAAAKIAHDSVLFSAAAHKLSNAAVKKSAVKAAGAFTKFSADLSSFANNPTSTTQAALDAELPDFQSAMEGIDTTCDQ